MYQLRLKKGALLWYDEEGSSIEASDLQTLLEQLPEETIAILTVPDDGEQVTEEALKPIQIKGKKNQGVAPSVDEDDED